MVRAAVGLLGDSVEAVSTSAAQCLARLRAASADGWVTCARAAGAADGLRRLSRAAPTRTEEDAAKPLEYGFVRASLMTKLTSANKADWQSRAKAIAALQTELREPQPTRPPRQAAAARPPARPPAASLTPLVVAGRASTRAAVLVPVHAARRYQFQDQPHLTPGTPTTTPPPPPRSPGHPSPTPHLTAPQMISDVLDRFADSMATTRRARRRRRSWGV